MVPPAKDNAYADAQHQLQGLCTLLNRVIVGQNHGARYRLAGEIALHLLAPILIGLPLIALGIWAGAASRGGKAQ